ncbi:hypothetical protein U1Q18_050793 [Sarracenia purpurea var. burkii]
MVRILAQTGTPRVRFERLTIVEFARSKAWRVYYHGFRELIPNYYHKGDFNGFFKDFLKTAFKDEVKIEMIAIVFREGGGNDLWMVDFHGGKCGSRVATTKEKKAHKEKQRRQNRAGFRNRRAAEFIRNETYKRVSVENNCKQVKESFQEFEDNDVLNKELGDFIGITAGSDDETEYDDQIDETAE